MTNFDIQRNDDIIRTEFIIENIFGYLLRNLYQFKGSVAVNEKETQVLNDLVKILNAFREFLNGRPTKTYYPISTSTELRHYLLCFYNEFFAEGITWSRIVAYFYYIGETLVENFPQKMTRKCFEQTLKYVDWLVKNKLQSWINDHGGWEAMKKQSDNV